jgi:hypothetical protein
MKPYNLIVLFRFLVALSGLVYLLYFFFPIVRSSFIAPQTLELLELNGFESLYSWPVWLQWVTFGLYWIALVGLFLFKPAARLLFVCLTLFFLFSGLGLGLEVASAIESFIGTTLTLIDGALIALLFASPLADEFRRTPADRRLSAERG